MMLLVDHYVSRSMIHGLGVFASAEVKSGTVVWRFDPVFDIEISLTLAKTLSESDLQFVMHHAEYIEELGVFRLGNDGDMFMNHCGVPNLIDRGDEMRAGRDIAAGEELTCNYHDVCVIGYSGGSLSSRIAAR